MRHDTCRLLLKLAAPPRLPRRCYLLRTTSATFLTANQMCLNAGGSLAMPKSLDEQLMIERYFGRTRWVAGSASRLAHSLSACLSSVVSSLGVACTGKERLAAAGLWLPENHLELSAQ